MKRKGIIRPGLSAPISRTNNMNLTVRREFVTPGLKPWLGKRYMAEPLPVCDGIMCLLLPSKVGHEFQDKPDPELELPLFTGLSTSLVDCYRQLKLVPPGVKVYTDLHLFGDYMALSLPTFADWADAWLKASGEVER